MFEQLLNQVVGPIAQQATNAASARFRSLILRIAAVFVAALLGVTGAVWLSWAGFEALSLGINSIWAAVIVAAALLALAAILAYSTLNVRNNTRRPAPAAERQQKEAELAEAIAVAERIMREQSGSAAMMALVAGLAAGIMSDKGSR